MTGADHAANAWAAMRMGWEVQARNESISRAIMAQLTDIAEEWEYGNEPHYSM